jgi:hypothetical protein
MGKLGLRLNEDKTVVRYAQKEHFDFLGYTFGLYILRKRESRIWEPALQRKV